MQLRYNFRVYPNPAQVRALGQAFGCARVVFNDALRARQTARENGQPYPSDGELSKRIITQAKATPERAWLGEVSAVVLQQALTDLNTSYRNFFASVSGKRKGRKLGPGRAFARIDRWLPTSQTCSECGRIDGPKPLSVRSWTCLCGATHDRDINAARNVLAAGQADNSNDRGAQVRPVRAGSAP